MLPAGTSPSFGQLTGGDELPGQQVTTAKENQVILFADTISQLEEYLRDYIEREETRAGHKLVELKLTLISQTMYFVINGYSHGTVPLSTIPFSRTCQGYGSTDSAQQDIMNS